MTSKQTSLICLSHCSDDLILEFSPNKTALQREIVFFWYHDRYFNWNNFDYFHLIIVDPSQVLLRGRNGNVGFDGIHQDYLKFYKWGGAAEPAIVVSPSKIKPTLIARINHESKTKDAEIVYPKEHKGVRFKLMNVEGDPKRLDEINELSEIISEIKLAVPIVQPEKNLGKYGLQGFTEFITEKNGTFL